MNLPITANPSDFHAIYHQNGDTRQPAYDVERWEANQEQTRLICLANPQIAWTLKVYQLKLSAWVNTQDNRTIKFDIGG